MAKPPAPESRRKNPPLLSLRQIAEFTKTCDALEQWAYVRPTKRQLDTLLDGIEATQHDRAFQAQEQAWWAQALAHEASWRPPVGNWATVDGFTLVLLASGWLELSRSERAFLSADVFPVKNPADRHFCKVRAFLFQRWLKWRAEAYGLDPGAHVRLYVTLQTLGPDAFLEVARRAEQHVGFPVGVVPFIPETAQEEFDSLMKWLSKIAVKGAAKDMRESLAHDELFDRAREAVVTILGRKLRGKIDPRVAVALALDGRFNVVPDAVKKSLRTAWARKGRGQTENERSAFDITFGPVGDEENREHPLSDPWDRLSVRRPLSDASSPPSPLDEAALNAFLKQHHDLKAAVEALAAERSQAGAARRLGIAVKTLRARLVKAKFLQD